MADRNLRFRLAWLALKGYLNTYKNLMSRTTIRPQPGGLETHRYHRKCVQTHFGQATLLATSHLPLSTLPFFRQLRQPPGHLAEYEAVDRIEGIPVEQAT